MGTTYRGDTETVVICFRGGEENRWEKKKEIGLRKSAKGGISQRDQCNKGRKEYLLQQMRKE